MPGRVVTHFNARRTPDLWFALEEGSGIEVAGRDCGRPKFQDAVRDKRRRVRSRMSLKEGFISVWGLDLDEACKERVL